MKNLLVALGVSSGIALAACGGRVVVDGVSSGAGGQGGQSGTTSAFSATASAVSGSFPTTGSFITTTGSSSSKATSGGGCASCADLLAGIAKPDQLCPGEAVGLFKDLDTCVCAKICAKPCANNFCISFNVTAASP